MISWIKEHLAPEASEWWRLSSIQLAAGVAAIGGAITANPEVLLALAGLLPVGGLAQILVVALVIITLFVVPTLTRLWNQDCETKPDKNESGEDA